MLKSSDSRALSSVLRVLVVRRDDEFVTIVLSPLKRVCSEVEDVEEAVSNFATGFALDLESLRTIIEVNGRRRCFENGVSVP